MKFNVKIDLVKYTPEEYNQHIKVRKNQIHALKCQNLDKAWGRDETDYLWDLCEKFDLRFIVIYDRYDPKYNRSVEDLKERFYQVNKKILEVSG